MDWTTPVPLSIHDGAGSTWVVRRAWPHRTPGDFVMEVLAPGRPGVRGARLRQGQFKLIPADDPKLPALRAEAQQGDLELRLRENRMTPERYRTAHTQVLAAAEELHVNPDRFHAYSDARWLRLAYMPLRGRFSLALAVVAEKKATHRKPRTA